MSTNTSRSIRLGKARIAQAMEIARMALGREVTERQAIELCVSSLDAGALDMALDRVVAEANEWAVARLQDRDKMWTLLLLSFAARETDAVWRISTSEGRPWLHREGTHHSTGEALAAACDIDGLVEELKAGGALDEMTELN